MKINTNFTKAGFSKLFGSSPVGKTTPVVEEVVIPAQNVEAFSAKEEKSVSTRKTFVRIL